MSGTCQMPGCSNPTAIESRFCAQCLLGNYPSSSSFHDVGGHPDSMSASRAEGFLKTCEYTGCTRLVPRADRYCTMCLSGNTPPAPPTARAGPSSSSSSIWGSRLPGSDAFTTPRCRYILCRRAPMSNSSYCVDHAGTGGGLAIPSSACSFPGCGQTPASGSNYCSDCLDRRYPGDPARGGGTRSTSDSTVVPGGRSPPTPRAVACGFPGCSSTPRAGYNYCDDCQHGRHPGLGGRSDDSGAGNRGPSATSYGSTTTGRSCMTSGCSRTPDGGFSFCNTCLSTPESSSSTWSDPVCQECRIRPKASGSTKCSECRLASIERWESRSGGAVADRCKSCRLNPRKAGYDECDECHEYSVRCSSRG